MEVQNIFDKNGRLIGQDYQRHTGEWMHKWKSVRHEGFDKFSWRGKAQGEDMDTWTYDLPKTQPPPNH